MNNNELFLIVGAIAVVVSVGAWLLNKYVTKPKSAVVPKTLIK